MRKHSGNRANPLEARYRIHCVCHLIIEGRFFIYSIIAEIALQKMQIEIRHKVRER